MNLALKMALLEKGVRQIEVAQALRMDPSKLSKAANGWIQLRSEERVALAEYLGRSESELFPESNPLDNCEAYNG